MANCEQFKIIKKRDTVHDKPFSSHLVNRATVTESSKLWLYLVCFNSQNMKQIAYFSDSRQRG